MLKVGISVQGSDVVGTGSMIMIVLRKCNALICITHLELTNHFT